MERKVQGALLGMGVTALVALVVKSLLGWGRVAYLLFIQDLSAIDPDEKARFLSSRIDEMMAGYWPLDVMLWALAGLLGGWVFMRFSATENGFWVLGVSLATAGVAAFHLGAVYLALIPVLSGGVAVFVSFFTGAWVAENGKWPLKRMCDHPCLREGRMIKSSC